MHSAENFTNLYFL